MSAANVITWGYGASGTTSAVVTLGYSCGSAPVTPVDWVAMTSEAISNRPGLKPSGLTKPGLSSHENKIPGMTGHTLRTV